MIQYQCDGCKNKYEAPDESAGNVVICEACGNSITIPAPDIATAPEVAMPPDAAVPPDAETPPDADEAPPPLAADVEELQAPAPETPPAWPNGPMSHRSRKAFIIAIFLLTPIVWAVAGFIFLRHMNSTMKPAEAPPVTVTTTSATAPKPEIAPVATPVRQPPAPTEVVPASTAVPLSGLAQLKFGMSESEVTAALGQPPRTGKRYWRIFYYYPGLEVSISDASGLNQIIASSPSDAQTPEGIRIGSTEEQMRAAYGEPDHVHPGARNSTACDYWDKGLSFSLLAGKVFTVTAAPVPRRVLAPIPLDGVGGVRFGMNKKEIVAALGAPESVEIHPFHDERYYSRGFLLRLGPAGISEVIAMTKERFHERGVTNFAGRTPEGVRIGSTEAQVTAAYASPDVARSDYALKSLEYWKQMLALSLANGKVVGITARSPAMRLESAPVPVEGMEKLQFGMLPAEIIAVLGTPDKVVQPAAAAQFHYYSRGVVLTIPTWRGLERVDCLSRAWWPPDLRVEAPIAEEKIGEFAGKTREGIGIGATEAQLAAAYGKARLPINFPNDPTRKRHCYFSKMLLFEVVNGKVAEFAAFAREVRPETLGGDRPASSAAPAKAGGAQEH